MAKPLFTEAEIKEYRKKRAGLKWEETKAVDEAYQIETVRRVHERPDEYLNALLIHVEKRGAFYVDFYGAFLYSDHSEWTSIVKESDIPNNRRTLHTILKALTQIPKSWARSAFVRFLRGIGKQRGSKYYGAGSLGPQYGWTGREVTAICEVIAGDANPYAKVLMFYADVQEEIEEADPDYEVVEYGTNFKATRVERDVEFLNVLCGILEKRGLADTPTVQERKPTKPRTAKIFKSGDIIRKSNLRDLVLPAHVRVLIKKRVKGKKEEWVPDALEQVVLAIRTGQYHSAFIVPDRLEIAFTPPASFYSRDNLLGATYVGPWKGKIQKVREFNHPFEFRYVGK